jgi:cytochrome P450
MQLISDLELSHLAVDEDWFGADPIPQFQVARARHPWLATSPLGYVVTEYKSIRELFLLDSRMRGNYDEMVEMMGAGGTPWGDFQLGHILNARGDRHKRLRDILAPAFTPRQANRHRQVMRDVMVELLDEWVPKRTFDFEEFASWYPIKVICRMIGSPEEAIPELRDSLEALGRSVSVDLRVLDAMQKGTERLDAYCSELIETRLAMHEPGDDNDLLDVLLAIYVKHELSHAELVNLLTFLLVAGYDTSKNVMTMMMFEMCRNPAVYARCAADLAYCAQAVDEAMRLHGTNNMMRIVMEDIEHRDVLIPAGTTLFFPWAIIGQDPGAIDDPGVFIPDRPNQIRHLGFGLGAHMCLGQHIARAQIAEGIHLIAQRITKPATTGPRGWRPFPGVWGMEGLPIEFVPA